MMTLANYGIGSSKHKDPNSAKALSKSLQIRNRAEISLQQSLKTNHRLFGDRRKDVWASIKEYYSRVPFEMVIWNKYQTKQCLVDSIFLLDTEFDPYKAQEAFQTLESMLNNLIYLPWHKEFRKIHTYSGQFKLIVSDPLIGVEEVLKTAGFEHEFNNLNLILPEERMPQLDDSESVTSVIFDCLLAQVIIADIIDVLEVCCKLTRQTISKPMQSKINCYSWIQSYFHQRLSHTKDLACSGIQELLNNVANHLSKLDLNCPKTSAKNDKKALFSEYVIADKSIVPNSNDIQDCGIVSTQERSRGILSQQSAKAEDLIMLPNDLLRIPKDTANDSRSKNHAIKGMPINSCTARREMCHLSEDQTSQKAMSQINGYQTDPIGPRQSPNKTNGTYVPFINQKGSGGNQQWTNSNRDSFAHPVRVDMPHNDREPLLSKQDRRFAQSQHAQSMNKNNLGDGALANMSNDIFNRHQLGHNAQPDIDSLSPAAKQRHVNQHRHFDIAPYSDNLGRHAQHGTSEKSQQYMGSAASKYSEASPYERYELRDKSMNSYGGKSVWSCGSCTFNNQITSEICEMCRNKK